MGEKKIGRIRKKVRTASWGNLTLGVKAVKED